MAYPPLSKTTNNSPSSARTTRSVTAIATPAHGPPGIKMCDSKTTATTESSIMDEHAPQSMLSLSTEASSQMVETGVDHNNHNTDHVVVADGNESSSTRRNGFVVVDDNSDDVQGAGWCGTRAEARPRRGSFLQQMEEVPRVYIEKLYENTVGGPCQGVNNMCEVEDLDFFTNCHQPLSFLGFGGLHHGDPRHSVDPADLSYHNIDEDLEPMPLPGAYAVSIECEYCGAPSTAQCDPATCPRPQLFFQKKRPPFAPRDDASLWDPLTDEAVISSSTTTTTNKNNSTSSFAADIANNNNKSAYKNNMPTR